VWRAGVIDCHCVQCSLMIEIDTHILGAPHFTSEMVPRLEWIRPWTLSCESPWTTAQFAPPLKSVHVSMVAACTYPGCWFAFVDLCGECCRHSTQLELCAIASFFSQSAPFTLSLGEGSLCVTSYSGGAALSCIFYGVSSSCRRRFGHRQQLLPWQRYWASSPMWTQRVCSIGGCWVEILTQARQHCQHKMVVRWPYDTIRYEILF